MLQRCQGNIWSVIPFAKGVPNAYTRLCPSKGVGHRDAHFHLEFAIGRQTHTQTYTYTYTLTSIIKH